MRRDFRNCLLYENVCEECHVHVDAKSGNVISNVARMLCLIL
jgi:hypothetical protein